MVKPNRLLLDVGLILSQARLIARRSSSIYGTVFGCSCRSNGYSSVGQADSSAPALFIYCER